MKKQTNNLNVEVEGGELALENDFGDIVIIPKNKRQWVEMKLQEGCHSCIDNLVATLPTTTDYAQDGLTVPENTIDPYSWVNPPKDGGYIPAIEKTAEAPYWLEMQRDYDKRNNLQGEPSKKYLNKRNIFLGTNLANHYTDKYISENNAKPSRADLLNQLSDKEYEFVSSLPQYQTPFWQETLDKIKLYSDPRKRRKIERILNSDEYSNQEKKELLNMYKDDPIMDKLSVTNLNAFNLFQEEHPYENMDNIVNTYYEEALSPKSRKKLQNLKDEYNIDFEMLYENARDSWNKGDTRLSIDSIEGFNGKSYWKTIEDPEIKLEILSNANPSLLDYYIKNVGKADSDILYNYKDFITNYEDGFIQDPGFMEAFDKYHRPFSGIKLSGNVKREDATNTIWHEAAHNVNQKDLRYSEKFKKDIEDALTSFSFTDDLLYADLNEDQKNEVRQAYVKNTKKASDEVSDYELKEFYNKNRYVNKPTEFWSFYSTQLRRLLKDKGLIKDYNDTITEEMLNDPRLEEDSYFRNLMKPNIKDSKKLVELINKLIVQNDGNEKLPDSKYYAKEGLVVPDGTNPIEPTYDAGMMPEMEINAEAPSWLKYKRDYEAQNPYTAQDLQADVDNRFANPVGREAIDKIDPESYRQDIKRNFMLKRDKEVTDYVRTNLVAEKEQEFYDKNGRKPSRPELMNMLTDREHDIVYSDPSYQPSLWDDTLRGLQSLTEFRKKRRMTNILKSDKYSDREKQQMIDMYKDDPVMAKIDDALKVFSATEVPAKMVQAAFRDDYSMSDAVRGRKNDATMAEDVMGEVLNPINYIGGAAVKAGAKALGKTAKAARAARTTKDIDLNILKKLSQLDASKDNVFLQEMLFGMKDAKLFKEGERYFKELSKPESIKRLKDFGDEYGIDLYGAYKKAINDWENNTVISNYGAKNKLVQTVSRKKIDSYGYEPGRVGGVSKMSDEDEAMSNIIGSRHGFDSKEYNDFVKRANRVNEIAEDSERLFSNDDIVWHELSHFVNSRVIDDSPKLRNHINDIFFSEEEYAKIYQKLENKGLLKNDLNYVTRPTETWAFLSTNLRQDLKKAGIIENYTDEITVDILNNLSEGQIHQWDRFGKFIKDKEAFVKLYNKMTLAMAPLAAAAAVNANKENK